MYLGELEARKSAVAATERLDRVREFDRPGVFVAEHRRCRKAEAVHPRANHSAERTGIVLVWAVQICNLTDVPGVELEVCQKIFDVVFGKYRHWNWDFRVTCFSGMVTGLAVNTPSRSIQNLDR